MAVLERLSERTRRALELARAEARLLGHHHIGTEHLLLGLLAEGGSGAARTLVAAGATLDGARDKVAEAVGRDDGEVGDDELPYTARASRALERASRLSLQRRDEHVGTEHVLLSVLDVEGTAGQVLRVLGVDVAALRDAIDLDEGPGPVAAEPRRQAGGGVGPDRPVSPRCPDCRASLDGALAYRVMAAERGAAGGGAAEGGAAARRFAVVYCAACGSALGATAG